MEMTQLATPRHPIILLPLLPSGPGGVHSELSRGDQLGHHRAEALSFRGCALSQLLFCFQGLIYIRAFYTRLCLAKRAAYLRIRVNTSL